MRPRIDCARTALSPRAANCWRATNAAALAHALFEERADAGPDLPLLFRPADRPPCEHEIAERLDPFVRGGTPAPEIEQVHAPLGIEADHDMHRVVAAIGGHRVVGAAVDAKMLARRDILDGAQPLRRALAAAACRVFSVAL